ncbi:MAG: GH92 family glycosyl hydrolase [Prevotellaceae bacterium]|nr:GH92 family glycosyl hydrolase [Prevotellaceae bacterium]
MALLAAFLYCGCSPVKQNGEKPVYYVNPFIGATTKLDHSYHGLGKTFPGATTPFGMTQVSPNTITGGDNGSGYSHEHKTIEGFAFTQMSGVGWYGDLGNFLVMPTTGELILVAGKENDPERPGYRSEYSKQTEKASAGYYVAELLRYNIKAEATASPHGGILKFTFPENKKSRIQVDLARRVGGTSTLQYVEQVDKNTIRGWMKCTPEGGGWGNGKGHPDYTVSFYARFSKDLDNYGYWSADISDTQVRKLNEVQSKEYQNVIANSKIIRNGTSLEGKNIGFFTEFPTEKNEEVALKVGISFVDMDGAQNNFNAELSGKNFNQVCREAGEMWNTALRKIEIKGGTKDQKTIFYTALYHTMLDPRAMSDVDGRYPGPNGQIHRSSSFTKRTIFSGWDVFRSLFPLQTIINLELVNDEIGSLVTLAEQSGKGYLERWEFFNAYSGCMIGNPAISLATDAYAKGIRGYDVEKTYQAVIATSAAFGNGKFGYTPAERGYSISETLEYAYFDWCVAELAKMLNKTADEKKYRKRALFYKNIFDSEYGWFRSKKQSGAWEDWPAEGRLKEWYGCIESNPYQQGWFVPHDVEGMTKLMGGKEKVIADLENFFEKTPADFLWNEYYNHANELVHHVPFLFNRLDAPWLTQKWTRFICENAYENGVEGLTGNEDVGQMSAWYILAASGIHPVCPGEPRYELTSPVFDEITFRLNDGKTFMIKTLNNSSENIYIQNAALNGEAYNKCYINHSEIIAGGELVLKMGRTEQKKWGIEK